MPQWVRRRDDLEGRIKDLEDGIVPFTRPSDDMLTDMERRLRAIETQLPQLLEHVKVCEEMGRQASEERASLRKELRAFGVTILVTIVTAYLASHGLHMP